VLGHCSDARLCGAEYYINVDHLIVGIIFVLVNPLAATLYSPLCYLLSTGPRCSVSYFYMPWGRTVAQPQIRRKALSGSAPWELFPLSVIPW